MEILKYESQSIGPGGRCRGIRLLWIQVLMVSLNIKTGVPRINVCWINTMK